ncbi:MAG TPA: tRNA lysidine(34) synthetase TilS [Gammaproteobacteria bacterium]|nr:tRNA lysidine(34) synthetase TilS [Gammaproteobacteria bacterium]|tara:strand:+ start:492 stop:1865 length:1374 start_codon:yes stop_codon:yes gene_type:complete
MSLSNSLCDHLRLVLPTGINRRFVVAYSGGIDSQVLLHLMVSFVAGQTSRLRMVHIDHGLHKESQGWAEWCAETASEFGIEIVVLKINESPPSGCSVEAWARGHRYRLLESTMEADDVLLTAHHQNDVAETFLLQLLRGAGPHGLSSIAERQRFGSGMMLRPLLNYSRADIVSYAEAHNLEWIDDSSNDEDRYDRNYLRSNVFPWIERRWPAAVARIGHAVELQQNAAACLDEAADAVIENGLGTEDSQLSISCICNLNAAMQRSVLRRWIVRAGFPKPDAVHLHEIRRLINARIDAQPCVRWKCAEIRRYRDSLFLLWQTERIAGTGDYHWDLTAPLYLPWGVLSTNASIGKGLSAKLAMSNDVSVRFRAGGERCHPIYRARSQSLKRLFQEWGIPPWLRGEIPLIYRGNELIAVAGKCICRGFGAENGEKGIILQWVRSDRLNRLGIATQNIEDT